MLAPAKTPKDTLAQLEGWFAAAVRSPELKEKLGALGIYPEACAARTTAQACAGNTSTTAAPSAIRS